MKTVICAWKVLEICLSEIVGTMINFGSGGWILMPMKHQIKHHAPPGFHLRSNTCIRIFVILRLYASSRVPNTSKQMKASGLRPPAVSWCWHLPSFLTSYLKYSCVYQQEFKSLMAVKCVKNTFLVHAIVKLFLLSCYFRLLKLKNRT